MDRPNRLRLAASGVAFLLMTSGCRSLFHRHEIPPEPSAAHESAATPPAQFGSDPQALRATEGPQKPNGPVSGVAGNYGPPGTNSMSTTPMSGAPNSSAIGAPDPFPATAPSPGGAAPDPSGAMPLDAAPR